MPHYYSRKPPKTSVNKLVALNINNMKMIFETSPNVFSPGKVDKGTLFLLETICRESLIPNEGRVLDLGTGYGVIGVFLAKKNPRLTVYMIDVNESALRLARLNSKLNQVESRVKIIESNIYQSLEKTLFNTIYSNPPISAGWRVLEETILKAPEHLSKKGYMLMVFSRGAKKALFTARKVFNETNILSRRKGYVILLFQK